MIQIKDLEVDVVDTCNMRCVNCSHLSPHYKKSGYTFHQFVLDIDALTKVLHTHQVTFVGGEPLLLGDKLKNYIKLVRSSGIANTLRLITNGVLLHKHPRLVGMFDTVVVSLYPTEKSRLVEEWIKANPYRDLYTWKIDTFGEYYTPDELSDEESQKSWNQCFSKDNCNTIYNGRYYRCIGAVKYPHPSEGCDIHADNPEERLRKYIESTEKLPSCSHCYGGRNVKPWKEAHI